MAKGEEIEYTVYEDVVNSITHGVAAALSIAGLSVLVLLAAIKGDPWRIVAFSIYGSTLVLLYLSSTLYHGIRTPRVRRFLRRMDHMAIYLLIAGTYTPFALVSMRGGWGWFLLIAIWTLALAGILLKTFSMDRWEVVSMVLYVGMGWLAVITIKPAIAMIPLPAIIWMAVGGFFYTFGIVFYAWQRLPYNHAIWHLFVIAGSVAHFFAVLFFVLP